MKIIIQKYQLYPQDKPEGYAVGFNVQLYEQEKYDENSELVSSKKQVSKYYKEQLIPLKDAEGLTEDEIIDLAWQTVKIDVQLKEQEIQQKPSYLGKEWIPIQDRKKPETPEEPLVEEPSEDPIKDGKI